MSTITISKINNLLKSQPSGVVMLSSWLAKQGYSLDLQKRYRKSGWLESVGSGALIRSGDQVGYEGGIYALQNQWGSHIHPGGRTALAMLGKAQYLEPAQRKIILIGPVGAKLPAWFKNHDWGVTLAYYRSGFLPPDMGLVDIEAKNFHIKVSGAARALMECLYLTPDKQELFECYELMESLNNLHPDHVQMLLENCNSIKVKRLFMFLAEKAGHSWVPFINLKRIHFGSGIRSIVKNGVYDPAYHIVIPKELKDYGEPSL